MSDNIVDVPASGRAWLHRTVERVDIATLAVPKREPRQEIALEL